jgi:zinc/manganese transport system permease protein
VEAFAWMAAPVAACVVMALILGWFGLQVLERGVIFVDLALAQVAALGTTAAVFFGHEPDEPLSYALGLVFTVFGSVAFSMARRFEARVPQEAIIGIAYAVGAAAAAVLLDFAADPHGAEKLQHLTVGNVVWVTWAEIGVLAAVAAGVGAFHFVARERLLLVSLRPEEAEAKGISVPLWDLLFYLSFGVVITAIVHVGGVLLVFSYLIVPAVIARLFADGVGVRLAIAWAVSVTLSIVGIGVSYEHAAGPLIVVLLGGALVVALVAWALKTAASPARVLGGLTGSVGALTAVLWGFSQIPGEDHDHDHEAAPALAHPRAHDDLPADADPAAREAWYRSHAAAADELVEALAHEEDESLRLLVAAQLAKAGRIEGLKALADLAKSEIPFLRMEADDRLRKVAGDAAPAWDPLSGPDGGAWAAWAAAPPEGWAERATQIEPP